MLGHWKVLLLLCMCAFLCTSYSDDISQESLDENLMTAAVTTEEIPDSPPPTNSETLSTEHTPCADTHLPPQFGSTLKELCGPEEIYVRFTKSCAGNKRRSFESSTHPIVAVEVNVPATELPPAPKSRFNAYHASMGPFEMQWQPRVLSSLLDSLDLVHEKPFAPSFRKHLFVDYSSLPARPPRERPPGWVHSTVHFYVCDDRNGDGRCSDESGFDQLGMREISFRACHLPEVVVLEVSSCGKRR